MRLRIPLPTLAAGLVAGCIAAGTLMPAPATAVPAAVGGKAAPATAPAFPKPAGAATDQATETDTEEHHHGVVAPLSPEVLSQPSELTVPGATTRTPEPAGKPTGLAAAAAAAPGCTPADFSSRTGTELVSFILGSTTECVTTLFEGVDATTAPGVFKQSQMVPVAAAYKEKADAYNGTNGNGIQQLVLFLRAGYYAQYKFSGTVGGYDSSLTNTVKLGADAYFANPRSNDVTDANADILKEALILTDSINLQGSFLDVYKRYLNAYDASYDANAKMSNAVNTIFRTPTWRGASNPQFINALTADTSLLTTLADFAVKHRDLFAGANGALAANAGNNLTKLSGANATIAAVARPQVKRVLESAPIPGPYGALWVKVAYQVSVSWPGDCGYYGTCDLPAVMTAKVLPNQLTCDNRIIKAQALSRAELDEVCASLRNQDAVVHGIVKDNGPIPDQYAKTVVVGIFANKADYVTYSWPIFNNGTDNGGQTVMDATDPNNQARIVMHQKAWNVNDPARVWNLNHEYTHYLDAIYDMKGNFSAQMSVPTIWWVEGLAEYVSYTYRGATDVDAMAQAAKHTYKLSDLFQTTYGNADSTRVYPWGYLAVRYMLEKHPADVKAILERFRLADYQGAYALYNGFGTRYDADFDVWLNACAAGACHAPGPTSLFDQTVNGATVRLTDRSVQTGSGRIVKWSWYFGDGSPASQERNPSHTFAKAGSYTVALTTTDDTGRSATTPATVTTTVDGGPVTLPACTQTRLDELGRNCSRADRTRTKGNLDYLYVYLPAGTSTLKVDTSGGTGTAHLYYNADTWASPSAFTASSTQSGTTQSITVTNPTAGYRYISLYAVTDFSGVTVSTRF
ncbi:collagenase [Kitasatospora aburaviensis]|uniref:microbial collagenase n=1 Tax=Kitasatospora aburaviensis TaxID=67265 RepID=A0ABW1F4N3_9ACTN